jgi:hypothetical protein
MTHFVNGGWELLRDEFKVAGTNLEWAKTRIERKETWYIRLGETGELNPAKIFRNHKNGITVPRSTYIGRRQTTKFVREALAKILSPDKIKALILRYSGIEKDEEQEDADSEESKTEEEEKLSDTEEVKEVTDFVPGQGILPVDDFPFLNRFKIPLENDDNVRSGLVNDMVKFCSDQNESIEFRSRGNNRNRMMLTIPKGKSPSTLPGSMRQWVAQ